MKLLLTTALSLFTTKGGVIATTLLAEGAAGLLPGEISPLINLGAIGCVLAWFMLRMEPRMRKQEEAQDRGNRLLALVVIAIKSINPAVKEQIESVIGEINDAEAARKKG